MSIVNKATQVSVLICVLGLIAPATTAQSKKSRGPKGDRVPKVIKEEKREKVDTAQQGPNLSYRDFGIRQIEIKLEKKRRDLINRLDDILASNPPKRERPELLFQKAELFQEQSQFHFFEGMGLDDKIGAAEDRKNTRAVKSLKAKKAAELKKSRDWVRDAVILYKEIEDEHPKYRRMPEVLFALGRAYWDAQSYKNALQVYRKIVKSHGNSQFVPDAWLAFGEYYFEYSPENERDLNKALSAYNNVLNFEESMVYGYAIYKKGWVQFNLNQFEEAAERFKEVILYSDINSEILGERRLALAREARRDYVLAYSRFGAGQAAKASFGKLAKNDEDLYKMLKRVGDMYYGDGKDRDAIVVYQTLMDMKPNDIRNPVYQGKIVKAAHRIGTKEQVVKQSEKLVALLTKAQGQMKRIPKTSTSYDESKMNYDEAERVTDNVLRSFSTTWHNEAKKTRYKETYAAAKDMYELYLKTFAKRKEAYDIRFYYAELLYRLEDFEHAGEEYTKVFNASKKGKWRETSAEEAVRAYDELIKDYDAAHRKEEEAKLKKDPKLKLKERPIPPVKNKYLEACETYVRNYPKGAIAPEAKYSIARVHYGYGYYDKAVPGFLKVIKEHPKHKRAEQAADLVLDTYNLKKDWANVDKYARQFVRNKYLMQNADFKSHVQEILEQGSFKRIQLLEKKQEYAAAAKAYVAFTKEFRKSDLGDKALANGAAMYARAGEMDKSIQTRKELIARYPKSELVKDQVYAVAAGYENKTDFKNASTWLTKFAEKYAKDERSRDALLNASVYQEGIGDVSGAIETRKLFLKRYPKDEAAIDVAYTIPHAYERSKQWVSAVKAYNSFASKYKNVPAGQSRAVAAQYKAVILSQQHYKGAAKAAESQLVLQANRYGASKGEQDPAADGVAYVAFQRAEKKFEAYQKQKIASPNNTKLFQKSLKDKKDKNRAAVIKGYVDVVKMGSPEWAVASLYRVAQVTKNLMQSINAVPAPRGFNAEQRDIFKQQLEELTLPLEDDVVGAMDRCVAESGRLGVYNDWTEKCVAYLQKNRPEQYPNVDSEKIVDVNIPQKSTYQSSFLGAVLSEPEFSKAVEFVEGTAPNKDHAPKGGE